MTELNAALDSDKVAVVAESKAILGFIMIIIPQLLVIIVLPADEKLVMSAYGALGPNIKDWSTPASTLSPVPGTIPLGADVLETTGLLSEKSYQSLELEVVMVKVFLGVDLATRGYVS